MPLKSERFPGRGPQAHGMGCPPGSLGGPRLALLREREDLQPGKLPPPSSSGSRLGLDPLPWLSSAPSTLLWPWNLWSLLPHQDRMLDGGRGLQVTRASSPPSPRPKAILPISPPSVLFNTPVSVSETTWANTSVDLGPPGTRRALGMNQGFLWRGDWLALLSTAEVTGGAWPSRLPKGYTEATKAPNMHLLNAMCPQP